MNTEFPRRIPTVRNTSTNSVVNNTSTKTSSTESSTFQKETKRILKETLKCLEDITDSVSDLTKTGGKTKDTKKSKAEEANTFGEKSVNILSEGLNTLKRLFDTITDFFTNKIPSFFSGLTKGKTKTDTNTNDTTDDANRDQKEWYANLFEHLKKIYDSTTHLFTRKGAIEAFKNFDRSWKNGIKGLQDVLEGSFSTIGDAVGSVFGQGLFGKMISGIITKALSFAVGKVILGFVVANLPITGIALAIVAALGLIIYFNKEIWNAIKWVGWCIDQGIDAIISWFGKSKYEESRKEMAKEAGVKEKDILEYYGDTVRGRNQAYEDWKKAQTDEAFKQDLLKKIKETVEINTPKQTKIKDFQDKSDKVVQYISNIQNNYGQSESSSIDGWGAIENADIASGGLNFTPITNVTNYNTSNNVSSGFNNISDIIPTSTVDNRSQMTPIKW